MTRAMTVTVLFAAWVFTAGMVWPLAVSAGTLSSDMKIYDWTSLGWACTLGLLGGVLALIVSLASDQRLVIEVLKESARNAIVSPIAGGCAYLILELVASMEWYTIPAIGRFIFIIGAGWAGIAFIVWVKALAKKAADAAAEIAGKWIASRGG